MKVVLIIIGVILCVVGLIALFGYALFRFWVYVMQR